MLHVEQDNAWLEWCRTCAGSWMYSCGWGYFLVEEL